MRPTHICIVAGGTIQLQDAPASEANWRHLWQSMESTDALSHDAAAFAPADAAREKKDDDRAGSSGSSHVAGDGVAQAAQLALLHTALDGIGDSSDWFHWARSEGLYVSRDALVARLGGGEAIDDTLEGRLIVVDVRDDDVAGGMVRGAIHCPDGCFGVECVRQLICRASEEAALARSPNGVALSGSKRKEAEEEGAGSPLPITLLLHCMESARRAPRCARRLVAALEALRQGGHSAPPVAVRVLEGGFDQFCRRHWQDPRLVQGYDDDYWGYEAMGGTQLTFGESSRADTCDEGGPTHATYVRPADQVATPWSGPGSSAA
jgi:hypothetical protein